MNKLSVAARAEIVTALVEGASIRAVSRMTGRSQNTIMRLLGEVGTACAALHDRVVRNVSAKHVQADEIHSYVGVREKNLKPELRGTPGVGDTWVWVAMDRTHKLAINYLVGDRGPDAANRFMADLASRVAGRISLSTDGLSFYLEAVARAFHYDVDYAMVIKSFGSVPGPEGRYSPPVCNGVRKVWVMGKPNYQEISTSHVERQNLTMRMQIRRFTRLTNAFSKKLENHVHSVALHFAWYNFVRRHMTLTRRAQGVHTTPAMAAGLTDRAWKVSDLVGLLEQADQAVA